ncbi:hypothetical protein Pelo_12617 [Pelomyxa schiedti]|nr:hypothetical protein Pelo_12617 [Pelomyxa schiedti]
MKASSDVLAMVADILANSGEGRSNTTTSSSNSSLFDMPIVFLNVERPFSETVVCCPHCSRHFKITDTTSLESQSTSTSRNNVNDQSADLSSPHARAEQDVSRRRSDILSNLDLQLKEARDEERHAKALLGQPYATLRMKKGDSLCAKLKAADISSSTNASLELQQIVKSATMSMKTKSQRKPLPLFQEPDTTTTRGGSLYTRNSDSISEKSNMPNSNDARSSSSKENRRQATPADPDYSSIPATDLEEWLRGVSERSGQPLLQYLPLFTLQHITPQHIKQHRLDKSTLKSIGVNKRSHRHALVSASKALIAEQQHHTGGADPDQI